jgi:hypothetical protein
MTTPDTSAGSDGYTVKFGAAARTIDYRDDVATFTFTFDIKPGQSGPDAPPWTLILEHHKHSERTAAYSVAFDRAKRYVESRGYYVEVYGA